MDEKLPLFGLGRLYDLHKKLAQWNIAAQDYTLVLFAADNGVSSERISFYEPLQTSQLVQQHLQGIAPTAKLLQRLGKKQYIVDIGLFDYVSAEEVLQCKVRKGSENFLYQDALTEEEVLSAIQTGRSIWDKIRAKGFDIIGVGELGVGDTLCASACAAAASGFPAELLTGQGSGGDKVIAPKVDIINRACLLRHPQHDNVVDILARFGGLEIAALTGFMAGAVMQKIPVMLDGYVTAVAAFLASKMEPAVTDWLIAPILTNQRGHAAILEILNLEPIMYLDLNYGEGLASTLGLFMAEMSMQFCGPGPGR